MPSLDSARSINQKALSKKAGVEAGTQDHRVRRYNLQGSVGKLHTLSGLAFYTDNEAGVN